VQNVGLDGLNNILDHLELCFLGERAERIRSVTDTRIFFPVGLILVAIKPKKQIHTLQVVHVAILLLYGDLRE